MTSENGGTQNEVYMAEMWPLHEMSPFFFNGAQAVDAFFVMTRFQNKSCKYSKNFIFKFLRFFRKSLKVWLFGYHDNSQENATD